MKILDRLEERFGEYIPENLTKYIVFGQIAVFFLITAYPAYESIFVLQGSRLLEGQWWRLITYLFRPITKDVLFGAFVYYIFYLYGSTLERRWGSFRYFTYLFISFLANLALALLFPTGQLSNAYMYTTLFLAFAWLFPDFTLLVFFILPVKIKWLALIAWLGIIVSFLAAPFDGKTQILFSVSNFLIFFWSDLIYAARNFRQETIISKPAAAVTARPNRDPYHVCYICKTNELDNLKMQIRYCDVCKPTTCYCGEHITGHTHRV